MLRQFLLFVALGAATPVRSAPLPSEIPNYLESVASRVVEVVAADPQLMQEIGALTKGDLQKAHYDFDNAFRIHSVDHAALANATTLDQALVATGSYGIPYCLAEGCKGLAIVDFDPQARTAALRYIGRALQAQRLQEASERLSRLAPQYEDQAKIVMTDTVEYLATPDRLIAATDAQAADIYQTLKAHGATFSSEEASERVDELSVEQFRAYVAARSSQNAGAVSAGDQMPEAGDAQASSMAEAEDDSDVSDLSSAPMSRETIVLPIKTANAAPSQNVQGADLASAAASAARSTEAKPFPWWMLGFGLVAGGLIAFSLGRRL